MAENILHYNGIRLRVQGSGNLCPTFYGYDNVTAQSLNQVVMSQTPGREPTVLANFKGQRARLRLQVLDINEQFNINRIIIFVKPLWSQYPQ